MFSRKCVNLREPETICRCSLTSFFVVVSSESDRRLLDVEVKNLCAIAGFPRSDLRGAVRGLKITWTNVLWLNPYIFDVVVVVSPFWYTCESRQFLLRLNDLWFRWTYFIVLWFFRKNQSVIFPLVFFIIKILVSLMAQTHSRGERARDCQHIRDIINFEDHFLTWLFYWLIMPDRLKVDDVKRESDAMN